MELLTYQGSLAQTKTAIFVKKEPDTQCNGKIHRHERYCKKSAGWGTDHVGKGRCKLHGGCCTGPKSGNLRYSDFVPSALIEKYEEFSVEDDIDIKSLNDEIALIRAKIAIYESKNQSGRLDKKIVAMVELIRRLAETKQEVEEGKKSKMNVEIVITIVDKFIGLVDKYVTDIETKKQIAAELRRFNLAKFNLN